MLVKGKKCWPVTNRHKKEQTDVNFWSLLKIFLRSVSMHSNTRDLSVWIEEDILMRGKERDTTHSTPSANNATNWQAKERARHRHRETETEERNSSRNFLGLSGGRISSKLTMQAWGFNSLNIQSSRSNLLASTGLLNIRFIFLTATMVPSLTIPVGLSLIAFASTTCP